MVKLHCPTCGAKFAYSWLTWIWKAPFHYFSKRLTKYPYCGVRNWIRKDREG